jgi:hypothetical protein
MLWLRLVRFFFVVVVTVLWSPGLFVPEQRDGKFSQAVARIADYTDTIQNLKI